MRLDGDQQAVVREAFYMFRDTPGPDGPQGTPGGQISLAALVTLLRSLGFPVAEGDVEALRYAAAQGSSGSQESRRAAGEGDSTALSRSSRPFSYAEVQSIVESLKDRGPKDCEEDIRIVWEALEPQDGLVSVDLVRKLLTGPELGGELTAEDLNVLLGHLEAGDSLPALLSFEQFRQLVQPPTPLV